MLKGKTVLLGVSGSIAAYKIASLASALKKLDADVHVLMTQNATNFINPITFETLTGNKCLVDTFDRNFQYSVEHVSLAKKADVVMLAPASANVIGKIAGGIADDMLTTTVMACRCRKIIAPAMNTNMFENPIVQDNLKKLEYYRSQEGALLAAVGITGRKAAPGERKYLTAWAEMGFPAEMVAMAYDRTVTNTGTMKWAYCNAILKRWHSEGRHTPEDVTAGERHPHRNIPQKVSKAPAPAPVQTAAAQEEKERQILENERWMKAFLTNQEKNS